MIEARIGREASITLATANKVSGALAGIFHWPGPRLLLRPQRAMRFERETFGTKGSSWWSEGEYGRTYLTRAQAARAAFLG